MDEEGIRHADNNTMRSMVQSYFSQLFQSEINGVDASVLGAVKRKVTPTMNRSLLSDFSAEEVKNALFAIGDLKASSRPGWITCYLGECLVIIW